MTALLDHGELSLLDRFRKYFAVIPADTQNAIEQAQRIRYQVYCVENPFEDASAHPDGLERDEFDSHSAHGLLLYRPTGVAMGTARLVLPVPGALEDSFAVQRLCAHPVWKRLPLAHTAEVSRFSISKEFRRRSSDTLYEGLDSGGGRRSGLPLMTLGLIQSLVHNSTLFDITHWCAMMEPALLRLLAGIGIRFEPMGSLLEYHGLRQPCYVEVETMLSAVRKAHPKIWDVLTDGTIY